MQQQYHISSIDEVLKFLDWLAVYWFIMVVVVPLRGGCVCAYCMDMYLYIPNPIQIRFGQFSIFETYLKGMS